jgi:hypothetical protein
VRRRVLLLLSILALSGCGSSHRAHSQHARPLTPVLSTLLAHRHGVHFTLHGTITVDEQSLLSHLHQVPPLQLRAAGEASRDGLKGHGSLEGEVSGSGAVVVVGTRAYARTGGTWYDLGRVEAAARLLRGARWMRSGNTLRGALHLSARQLERISGARLPFGVEGADLGVTIHLSGQGERVRITRPRSPRPLPPG